jgi:hypothetical protein
MGFKFGKKSNLDAESTHESVSIASSIEERKVIDMYSPNTNSTSFYVDFGTTKGKKESNQNESIESKLACNMCNMQNSRENFIILSCNHIFHVQCMAKSHFDDVYQFNVLDNIYFSSRKCTMCQTPMQTEELVFLHSKFLSGTKQNIETHQKSIEHLESQIQSLKNELNACYEYKHKLDHQREKSKQIVAHLMTMD